MTEQFTPRHMPVHWLLAKCAIAPPNAVFGVVEGSYLVGVEHGYPGAGY
jgi:hypothetical protein